MLWSQKKKIKDLLSDRDVENKLGNVPNSAGLGGLSRLFWPYGALTQNWLSPPKAQGSCNIIAFMHSWTTCVESQSTSFISNGFSLSLLWK